MGEAADQGRRLEQLVAEFFARNGYATRCNAVLEGRSGGSHEIDVLAEKSDALATYRVAIECKAWQSPIEKSVVSKLDYVVRDLGLSKGIIVALAGCHSGAQRTADDLGIDLWGPDELRRHLGDRVVDDLGMPITARSSTTIRGQQQNVDPEWAKKLLRTTGRGFLGIGSEQVIWSSPIWLPVHAIRLTCAQPDTRSYKKRLRSTTVDNMYEALSGSYVGRVPSPLVELDIDRQLALPPSLRDTKVHSSLRKAFSTYERVTSAPAKARHAESLTRLGVATPCSSLAIDQTSLIYLPYYAGVLESKGQQQHIVAIIGGKRGMPKVSETITRVLTANLALVRSHFSDGAGRG